MAVTVGAVETVGAVDGAAPPHARKTGPAGLAASRRTRLFGSFGEPDVQHEAAVQSPQPRTRCGVSCGEIVPSLLTTQLPTDSW